MPLQAVQVRVHACTRMQLPSFGAVLPFDLSTEKAKKNADFAVNSDQAGLLVPLVTLAVSLYFSEFGAELRRADPPGHDALCKVLDLLTAYLRVMQVHFDRRTRPCDYDVLIKLQVPACLTIT
jgi:hypothetical protein